MLDGVLLAGVLAFGLWRLLARRAGRRVREVVGLALAGLALLQLVRDDFTWQFLPAYALILAAAAPLSGRRPFARWVGRLGLAALLLATLGPWALLPVPRLPKPDGPYAVGTETFRWVDAARPEPATDDPADRRNVVVQAWYPAPRDARGPHNPYMDGLNRLPPRVAFIPRFVMARYGRIDTHAAADAPLTAGARPWPVVIFSPGYGGPRAFYTGLLSQLASRGYVVLALDHPYEAAVTQLGDGRVVTTVERFTPGDRDRLSFMADHQAARVADIRFVLDRLAVPGALGPRLSGRLDVTHPGVIGHSLGGAAAAAALDQDPRLHAAANIDGTLYGPVADHHLARPFLLLQSDPAETHHSQRFNDGARRLLGNMDVLGYRYEITRANHYSFTDAAFLFSAPGRLALSWLIGGGRGPAATQRATADILDAFLRGPLTGTPGDIGAAVARYPGVVGGPVWPSRR